ncbi:hypothetical protein ACFTAO_40095 [Paenibacillus rhizoplanae]
MNSLLNVILTTDFAFSVLRVTTPILFAALGGADLEPGRNHQHRDGRDHAGLGAGRGYSERLYAERLGGTAGSSIIGDAYCRDSGFFSP